jgi:glutaredoxin
VTRLTLYGKPGCHLCDDAREAVAAVSSERDFELEEVDITLDPLLFRRYAERIPVVAIDGRDALELLVDAKSVRDCLDTVAP